MIHYIDAQSIECGDCKHWKVWQEWEVYGSSRELKKDCSNIRRKEWNIDSEKRRCPKCGSSNVYVGVSEHIPVKQEHYVSDDDDTKRSGVSTSTVIGATVFALTGMWLLG